MSDTTQSESPLSAPANGDAPAALESGRTPPSSEAPGSDAPAAPVPAPPTDADLAAELAALQVRNADLIEQYLRAQADMQNTRRRADEEISKARKFAVESFAESLLPVADSLEAGMAVVDAAPEVIREGAQATLRQLTAALERNKVIAINPQPGTRFDPHQHQAISVVPAEQEANTVVGVLQKGYLIAERVLRPALVTVTGPK